MTAFKPVSRTARRFARGEAGVVAIFVALTGTVLVGVAGMAVDFARLNLVQSRMQEAADAAAVAAARERASYAGSASCESDIEAYARNHFDALYGQGFMQLDSGDITFTDFQVTESGEAGVSIAMRLEGDVPLGLSRLLTDGQTQQTISVSTRIKEEGQLRLALVTDTLAEDPNGVSPAGGLSSSELDTVETELKDTVDSVVPGSGPCSPDNVYVSVVPYTGTVNIAAPVNGAAGEPAWLEGDDVSSTYNPVPSIPDEDEWWGCVMARSPDIDFSERGISPSTYADDFDEQLAPPSAAPFVEFLYPSHRDSDDDDRGHVEADHADIDPGGDNDSNERQENPWGAGMGYRNDSSAAPGQKRYETMLEPATLYSRTPAGRADDSVGSSRDYDKFDIGRDMGADHGSPVGYYVEFDDGASDTDISDNTTWGPNVGCGDAVQPMTRAAADLKTHIDELEITHRGGRASNLGLVWGWRTLAESWRQWWNDDRLENHRPEWDADTYPAAPDDTDPDPVRVAVLLMAGDNGFRDNEDADSKDSDYTAYERADTFPSGVESALNDKLTTVCQRMRENGEVEIFTVAFDGGPTGALQDCAGEDGTYPGGTANFFDAANASQVQTAFDAIRTELNAIRSSELITTRLSE